MLDWRCFWRATKTYLVNAYRRDLFLLPVHLFTYIPEKWQCLHTWTKQKSDFASTIGDLGVSHCQSHLLKQTPTNVDASPGCLLLPGGLFPMSRISSASIVAKNTDVCAMLRVDAFYLSHRIRVWSKQKKSCWSPRSIYALHHCSDCYWSEIQVPYR